MQDEADIVEYAAPRPTLERAVCLRIVEEGARVFAALPDLGDAADTRESIESLTESLLIVDEIDQKGVDSQNVIDHARRVRSNCARSIALCIRGAIEWRHLPAGSGAALELYASLAPDAWSPAPAAAAALRA